MAVKSRNTNGFWDSVVTSIPLSSFVIPFFIMVGIILILNSCNNRTNRGTETGLNRIDTPFDKLLNEAFQIDYCKTNFRCIKLETEKDCFLGKISKMKVLKEKLFLLDVTSKALFCFNMDGKYLYKINSVGKGPGEYLNINDFDVDENKIILLDINGFKLLEYSLSGNFIKEKKLRNTALRALSVYDGKTYAYTVATPRQDDTMKNNWIIVYDGDFKAIKKIEIPELTQLSRATGISDYFIKKGDELLFTKSYDQTIYRVTECGLCSYLEMSFLRIPEEVQTLKQLFKDKQSIFCTGRLNAVNDSLLFMQFSRNGKQYEMVYNDIKMRIYTNSIESIYRYNTQKTNDMMFLTLSSIRCTSNDELYSLCEVGQAKSNAKVIKAKGNKAMKDKVIKSLIESIDSLNELQNPIVFCNKYYEN